MVSTKRFHCHRLAFKMNVLYILVCTQFYQVVPTEIGIIQNTAHNTHLQKYKHPHREISLSMCYELRSKMAMRFGRTTLQQCHEFHYEVFLREPQHIVIVFTLTITRNFIM